MSDELSSLVVSVTTELSYNRVNFHFVIAVGSYSLKSQSTYPNASAAHRAGKHCLNRLSYLLERTYIK